ncbi:MAG: murein biosynthesis integral membrane protein MurJ [Candidatus Nanopelagicales bacterium]|jgi:putative peptidoglycan lipid II flippase
MSDPVSPSEDAAGVSRVDLGEVAQAEPDQTNAVIRSSALMAVGTITSRITGVLRDITIAAALGSAILADTYALGNSLPNIIYILVIGGALNAVFIPQLVRHMRSDEDGGDGYADRLITLVGIILVVATALAILFAPLIVKLYSTSDFTSQQLSLATAFARFCLPQIIFYGLYTMFSQVLNSRLHFGAPMFAPIVNNIVMIATALGFMYVAGSMATTDTITSGQVAWLGIGTTLGVAAQAAVLIPVLIRVGYRWRPRFDFRGHGLGKAGSLAGWTIGLVLVNQIGFLVISRLATQANFIAEQSGDVPQGLATYQRAFLVFMLPHSVITISLVTALFPRMSKSAAVGALRDVSHDVSEGIRLICALLVPCVMFLIAFGPMLGTVFFGFGANRGAPATYTGLVVSVFAIGMLPFGVFYILLRGWYAVEDTRTPFIITVIYNVIAMPLTFLLFTIAPSNLAVCALALAYGLAYWITVGIAWTWLSRRLGGLETGQTVGTVVRMMIAGFFAALVGLFAVAGWALLAGHAQVGDVYSYLTSSQLSALLTLISGGIVTVLCYLGFATILRVSEVRSVISSFAGRLKR